MVKNKMSRKSVCRLFGELTDPLPYLSRNVGLSGNQLKIIALIAMTCDHVGKELLPGINVLQIVGRLAFPIFAYMIAEGCRYTRNRRKHLLNVAGLAILCQVVYFIAEGSLFQCILVTFSLSICMIYGIDHAGKLRTVRGWAGAAAICTSVYFISVMLPIILKNTDFAVDYGFWGILLPVFVYFAPEYLKVPMTAAGLVPLCLELGGIQWYSLVAVVLLMFYSGKRGKVNMKNLFFTYYPLHLVCIYLLGLFIA